MKFETLKTTIELQSQTLTQAVRDYSKAQVDYWRQVPALALEADGRTGYNDDHARAYYDRSWPVLLEHITWGNYEAFVDLNTGEIIDYPQWLTPIGGRDGELDINNDQTRKPAIAEDDKILRLANHLENLNAKRLVESLKEYAKQPYWRGYDQEKIMAWRTELRTKLKLTQPIT